MPRNHPVSWLVLGVVFTIAGCQDEPPVRAYAPELAAADLGAAQAWPADGYALLAPGATVGRFPCTLAIAELDAARDGQPRSILPTGQARWAETVRGVTAVQDLTFIDPVTLRSYGDDTAERCRAAVALGARLLLIYAPARQRVNRGEVGGVLFDAASATPIAIMYHRAMVTGPGGAEMSPEAAHAAQRERADDLDLADEPDFRTSDALMVAGRAFEASVRAALLELAGRDTPLRIDVPEQWLLEETSTASGSAAVRGNEP